MVWAGTCGVLEIIDIKSLGARRSDAHFQSKLQFQQSIKREDSRLRFAFVVLELSEN